MIVFIAAWDTDNDMATRSINPSLPSSAHIKQWHHYLHKNIKMHTYILYMYSRRQDRKEIKKRTKTKGCVGVSVCVRVYFSTKLCTVH